MAENMARVVSFPSFAKPRALVTLWEGPGRPEEQALRARLTGEGYQVVGWHNEPAQGYPPHAHVYPELLWLLRGSLTVILPVERRLLELEPGDRIEIPIGLVHGTMAGSEGASYLLATR
jgi:quercetin dioxygenase-like cupin family protein